MIFELLIDANQNEKKLYLRHAESLIPRVSPPIVPIQVIYNGADFNGTVSIQYKVSKLSFFQYI